MPESKDIVERLARNAEQLDAIADVLRDSDAKAARVEAVATMLKSMRAINEAAALIRSLRAERDVRVKPLIWEAVTDQIPKHAYAAYTPFNRCLIVCEFLSMNHMVYRFNGVDYDTLEAAKAAAQQDYDTRIRSAIEHVPPSEDDLVTPAYMAGFEKGKDRGIAIGREQAALIVDQEADKDAEQQKTCFAIGYDNQGHHHARAQRRLRDAASAIRAAKEVTK